jgi:hypothetical protein
MEQDVLLYYIHEYIMPALELTRQGGFMKVDGKNTGPV